MVVYKEEEFEVFLETIEFGQRCHWMDIARTVGVDKNTITAWKRTPEARKAIRDGIIHTMKCMEQAGSRDWRMWEAKLKMLGVDKDLSTNTQLEMQNPVQEIINKYGLSTGTTDMRTINNNS